MLESISPTPDTDSKLSYSHGIIAHGDTRTLYISGQIGADAAGRVAPDFAGQVHQAWSNLLGVLAAADMKVTDLVKVSAFLTDAADFSAYAQLRGQYLAGHKPTSTLLIVSGLARPEWKFEVEAVAVAAK